MALESSKNSMLEKLCASTPLPKMVPVRQYFDETHIDPSDINDQRTKRVRERVVKIIEALDTKLSIHDFQLVKEGGRYKASFDLMVPASYSKEVTRERKKQVDELLTAMNSRYAFEITLDHGIKEER